MGEGRLHDCPIPECAEMLPHDCTMQLRQAALCCVDQASLTWYYTNTNITITDITSISLQFLMTEIVII